MEAPPPSTKLSKKEMSNLSMELLSFGRYVLDVVKQARPTIDKMIRLLQVAISEACPGAVLEPYGSYATGLWLPTSDVDMVVHLSGHSQGANLGRNRSEKSDNGNVSGRDVNGNGNSAASDTDETYSGGLQSVKSESLDSEKMLSDAWSAFQRIASKLKKQSWAEDVMQITSSKMPVIKLKVCHFVDDILYGIPFDITVDPGFSPMVEDHPDLAFHSGVPVKRMVKYCLKRMQGLQHLTIVLKQYLRERGLNETYYGGVSSYTIFLMLVCYLQQHYPPLFQGEEFENIAQKEGWADLIHNLHTQKDKVKPAMPASSQSGDTMTESELSSEEQAYASTNESDTSSTSNTNVVSTSTSAPLQPNAPNFATTTRWRQLTSRLLNGRGRKPLIGELLMDFLYLFGEKFDYSNIGFTILHGGKYFNVREERRVGDPMWVDDPMRPGTNVAASHFQINVVAGAFRDAFLALRRHVQNPYHPTRLSRLIRTSPWFEYFNYEASTREINRITAQNASNKAKAADARRNVLQNRKMHSHKMVPPEKSDFSRHQRVKMRQKKKKQKRSNLHKKKKNINRKRAETTGVSKITNSNANFKGTDSNKAKVKNTQSTGIEKSNSSITTDPSKGSA